jgi:hypothetical protein
MILTAIAGGYSMADKDKKCDGTAKPDNPVCGGGDIHTLGVSSPLPVLPSIPIVMQTHYAPSGEY